MATAAHIDLYAGPNRFYSVAVMALWILAAWSVLAGFGTLPWPLIVAASLLLVWLRPGSSHAVPPDARLSLYRNGAAVLGLVPESLSGPLQGQWHTPSRTSRWATVVCVDTPAGRYRLLICASRNHPDDFRRLMIWSRFPPSGLNARAIPVPAP